MTFGFESANAKVPFICDASHWYTALTTAFMSRYFQKGQYQSTVALILYLLYAKSCPKSNQPLFRQVVRCGVKLAFAKCNLSTNNRLHNMLYTQPWSLVCLSTLACRPLSLESYLWAAFVLSPPPCTHLREQPLENSHSVGFQSLWKLDCMHPIIFI